MHLLFRWYVTDPLLAGAAFALALLIAGLLSATCSRLGGTFADAVKPSTNKLASLEGLRGILALSVVVHHAAAWYSYTQTKVWSTGPSIVFARFASFGVLQFFFISGYLFWRKLMKKSGIDLGRFYLSRFIRLGPLYYVCVGVALCIGVYLSGFKLVVSVRELAISLVPWLLFSLGGEPRVNGADMQRIVSGVVWTLGNEWLFYLALPFLAWFARKSKRLVHLACLFLLIFAVSKFLSSGRIHQEWIVNTFLVIREFAKFMLMGFGGGILIAAYQEKLARRVTLTASSRNWLLLGTYIFYLFVPPFGFFLVVGTLVLLVGFTLIVLGADLFGFITSLPVRFLGIVSYDLYLFHGINYYIAMLLRGGIHEVTLRSYLPQAAACLVSIILTSTFFHFLVERRSMKRSEKIARNPTINQASGHLKPEAAERVTAG